MGPVISEFCNVLSDSTADNYILVHYREYISWISEERLSAPCFLQEH